MRNHGKAHEVNDSKCDTLSSESSKYLSAFIVSDLVCVLFTPIKKEWWNLLTMS